MGCIHFHGNIPICEHSVNILLKSSGRLRIFNKFWSKFKRNVLTPQYLKYLGMQRSQLLVTIYYLKIYWHDMKLKLTLGYSLKNEACQWLFVKIILVCKLCTVLYLNLLRSSFNSIVCVKVEISRKKSHTRK